MAAKLISILIGLRASNNVEESRREENVPTLFQLIKQAEAAMIRRACRHDLFRQNAKTSTSSKSGHFINQQARLFELRCARANSQIAISSGTNCVLSIQ